jgi:hypothetical protein
MIGDKVLHIEDQVFAEWRLSAYGSTVIFLSLVLAWILFRPHWPIEANGYPYCVDFGLFWLSGKLTAAGHAAQIFDFPVWSKVQEVFSGPLVSEESKLPGCHNWQPFYYPPTYLVFTYLLGLMPYVTAFMSWLVALLFLYQATIYAIIPRRTALIISATPVFVIFTNVFTGQNGFITAGLLGLSLVLMERRPWISGILLGLLTYKPHFGVLFPIALLASRNWRVLRSAAVTAVVFGVLATLAFGNEGWFSFIHGLTNRTPGLSVPNGHELAVESVFGFAYWTSATPWFAWSVQLAVSAAVALGIWMLWASELVSYNLKAAACCAGSCLVSPYVMPYDLAIVSVSAAFFVREGLTRGFLPGERMALLMCWLLFFFIVADIGPVIYAILLFLVARRIVAVHVTEMMTAWSAAPSPLSPG